jgi:hypothetical protein
VCGGRARKYANGSYAGTCGLPGCIAIARGRRWTPSARAEVVADFSGQNIVAPDGGVFRAGRPDSDMSLTGCSATYAMDRA